MEQSGQELRELLLKLRIPPALSKGVCIYVYIYIYISDIYIYLSIRYIYIRNIYIRYIHTYIHTYYIRIYIYIYIYKCVCVCVCVARVRKRLVESAVHVMLLKVRIAACHAAKGVHMLLKGMLLKCADAA